MKLINKTAIFASAMIISNVALATVFTTPAVKVTSVIPSSAGSVIVGATGITANANPASCPNAGFLVNPSSAGAKNMYATLLTAMASGGSVSFGISESGCTGGFPTIDGLIVTPPA